MSPTKRMRRICSLPLGAGMVCGLVAGPALPAAADDEIIKPPTLLNLTLEPPNVTVTFRDNSEPDLSFIITLTERDNPGYTKITRGLPGAHIPGTGRTATRSATAGIKPGVAYCATVEAIVKYTDTIPNPFPLEDPTTGPSNKLCSTTTDAANPAGSPTDLSVTSVDGEKDLTVGTNRNFWVHYANAGPAVSGVTIEVLTSGPLSLRRPPDSGTFNGFQCAAVGSSGGATGGFRCTGGTLKAGEKGQIPLLATVAKKGFGAVHASISVAGDTNTGNNSSTYTVQTN